MSKHTPGPWAVNQLRIHTEILSQSAHCRVARIAKSGGDGRGDSEADAARIVECVNSHDMLVAALERVTAALIAADCGSKDFEACRIGREAFAALGVKK